MTSRLRQKMPDVITLPQLCKDAGWQSHAFGKLYHLGGGKDAEAKAALDGRGPLVAHGAGF